MLTWVRHREVAAHITVVCAHTLFIGSPEQPSRSWSSAICYALMDRSSCETIVRGKIVGEVRDMLLTLRRKGLHLGHLVYVEGTCYFRPLEQAQGKCG